MRKNRYLFTSLTFFLVLVSPVLIAQEQVNDSIYFQELNRKYCLYIPESYSTNKLYPLILNFHGTGGDGADYLIESNLTSIADTAGFLVVSPTATGIMHGNWNWVGPELTGLDISVDDPAFISALLDTLIDNYQIDTNRIYCMGQSRGGIFCYALACRLSDRIAAIAPIAGTMFTIDIGICKPTHPMPVFHIHGTHDETLPLSGRDYRFLPVPMVLDFWCTKNKRVNRSIVAKFTKTDLYQKKSDEIIICESDERGADVKLLKLYEVEHSIDLSKPYGNDNQVLAGQIWTFFRECKRD